ncbi:SDR family oxidoreductase [Streptomyces venezuelae]|nr:NAD(P)H-binding protein [Streptomyces venezuelae]
MRIAVTEAAGRLGGRVVRLLADRGDVDVVAVTRRRVPAGTFPARVEVAVADYAEPPALRAALKGVDTLVLVSSDGPDAQVLAHHRNLVDAAAASRVGHVAALSSVDAHTREQRWDRVRNDCAQLTGRPPLALSEVLAAHR